MARDVDPGFIDRAVESMAAYALRYLTQVLGVVQPRSASFLGTGFFCEIGGMRAVVTSSDRVSFVRGSQLFSGVVFSRGDEQPPAAVQGEMYLFEHVGIAFYVPSSEFLLSPGKEYWPVDRIERDPKTIYRDYLVVAGFPTTRATEFGDGDESAASMTHGSMMRYRAEDIPESERDRFQKVFPNYPFLPADCLAPEEFAVDFDAGVESRLEDDFFEGDVESVREKLRVFEEATPAGTRIIGPGGLVGSPVFRLGLLESASGWSPDCSRLVGVVTRWLPEHRALVATSSATLLEAFAEAIRSSDG